MGVALYQHVNRQQWGLAIEAWSRGSQRGFQFEDGRLRTFHEDYCHLMEQVSASSEDAKRRRATLVRLLGNEPSVANKRKRRRTAEAPKFRFDDQIELFRAEFPEGFQGEAWTVAHRKAKKRSLKRHRDPVVELAQERLSQEALDAWIEAEDYASVLEAVGEVLAQTDLVSASQRRLLGHKVDPADQRRFATALRDLLYGKTDLSLRFGLWVSELGKGATWSLVTVIPGLVQPDRHVCVRPTAFKTQAKVLMPQLGHKKQPDPSLYEGYRTMATTAREKLEAAGLEPRDLLDVYDFLWATLKPKALEKLVPKAEPVAEPEPAAA